MIVLCPRLYHVHLACKSRGRNLLSDVYSLLELYIIIENKIKLQPNTFLCICDYF